MPNNEARNEEKKYRIQVVEHETFPAAYTGTFMTSTDICKMASALFRSAFADFEGATFEVPNGGRPFIALYFNQREEGPEDTLPLATSKLQNANKTGSSLLDQKRAMDSYRKNGDRFYLTEKGKDAIEEFLLPEFINRQKNKPDWSRIVTPVATQGGNFFGGVARPIQYTKVNGISIDKLCDTIFGTKNEDGFYTHQANVLYSLPGSMPGINRGFMLRIDRMNDTQLRETAKNELGYIDNSGMNIIR